MSLELVNRQVPEFEEFANPSKYLLYNDYFLGILDTTIDPADTVVRMENLKRIRVAGKRCGRFQSLFQTAERLLEVLVCKATLGRETRAAYLGGDGEALRALLPRYTRCVSLLQKFARAYRVQWMEENKPHGFEVQDIRLGGLMQRTITCRERLEDYLAGKLTQIEELEEDLLDVCCKNSVYRTLAYNSYAATATVNRI